MSSHQIAMLVIIGGLSVLMMILTRRRVRKSQNSPRSYAREQIARLREERQVQSDVENVMLELERLSRQINAQIGTKFAKLEAVIRDADERIDTLRRLVHAAEGKPTVDVTVHADPTAPTPPDAQPAGLHNQVYALADAGQSPDAIAHELNKTRGEIQLILALRKTAPTRA